MTVYVDDMRVRFGNMVMCHMIADTEDELHAMADRIGVARRWYQGDHYDVALTKREAAMAAGAVEITWRECSMMMRECHRNPWAPLAEIRDRVAARDARLSEAFRLANAKQDRLL